MPEMKSEISASKEDERQGQSVVSAELLPEVPIIGPN